MTKQLILLGKKFQQLFLREAQDKDSLYLLEQSFYLHPTVFSFSTTESQLQTASHFHQRGWVINF